MLLSEIVRTRLILASTSVQNIRGHAHIQNCVQHVANARFLWLHAILFIEAPREPYRSAYSFHK